MHALLLTVSSFIWALSFLPANVSAHGFIASPRPRGYAEISYAIDNLRNPTSTGNFCRGKPAESSATTINLADGGSLTLKLALSIGAEHVGPCSLELWNSAGTKKITLANNVANCASDQGFKQKSPGASQQCPGLLPSGLVTDDMCLKDWTIQLPSLSGLDFNKGFLRWIWLGQHVSPAEYYENCADVNINYNGGSPVTTTTTTAVATTTGVATTTTAAATTTGAATTTTAVATTPGATTMKSITKTTTPTKTTTKKTTTTKTKTTTTKSKTPTPTRKPCSRRDRRRKRSYCKRDYVESDFETPDRLF